jgi:SSS family solute:Na+ symporter
MESSNFISSLPYFLFGIYLVVLLLQLFSTLEKKESSTIDKFAVGKKNYSVRILLFTILGTMIGPGFSYGAIEEFYQYGFGYTICFFLVVLQFLLFSKFFAGKMQEISKNNNEIVTIGGIIGLKYNKVAQVVAGLLSALFAIGLVATLSYAGGKVLADFTGTNREVATFFVIAFIMLYSFSGGIATIVKTDRINLILIGLFLLIGIGAGIYVFLTHDAGLTTLAEYGWNSTTKTNTPNGGWFNVGIAFLLGEIFIPVYSVRSMMTDDTAKSKKAFKWAALVGLIWFIALTFIAIAAHLVPPTEGKLIYLNLIDYVFGENNGLLGAIIRSIAIIGMLGVVVSTLDSILNAAGVSVKKDIADIFTKKQPTTTTKDDNVHRYAILIITLLGFIFAIFATGIVDTLLIAYSIWVPAVLCPIAYCLYANVKNKWTGFVGMIAGFLGWAMFNYFKIGIPILFGIIISAAAMIICERIKTTKK